MTINLCTSQLRTKNVLSLWIFAKCYDKRFLLYCFFEQQLNWHYYNSSIFLINCFFFLFAEWHNFIFLQGAALGRKKLYTILSSKSILSNSSLNRLADVSPYQFIIVYIWATLTDSVWMTVIYVCSFLFAASCLCHAFRIRKFCSVINSNSPEQLSEIISSQKFFYII